MKYAALWFLLALSLSASADGPKKAYPTLTRGWINAKNCSWILAGLHLSQNGDFPILPHGQLSSTLPFHPAKLTGDNAVPWSTIPRGSFFSVEAEAYGGTVERSFEKTRTGARPINLGNYYATFWEADPLFGVTNFTYRAHAENQEMNPPNLMLLEAMEYQLRDLVIGSTAPVSNEVLLDLMELGQDRRERFVLTEDGSITAGHRFVKLVFQFVEQKGFEGHVELELNPTKNYASIKAHDGHGVTYAIDFIYRDGEATAEMPSEISVTVRSENISLEYRLEFFDRLTVLDLATHGSNLGIQAREDRERAQQLRKVQGVQFADGYCKKRQIGGKMRTVFTATKFTKVENGKVTLELVPFDYEVPDYFEIKETLYEALFDPDGHKFELINANTGQRYEGGIWLRNVEGTNLQDTGNFVVRLPAVIIEDSKAKE